MPQATQQKHPLNLVTPHYRVNARLKTPFGHSMNLSKEFSKKSAEDIDGHNVVSMDTALKLVYHYKEIDWLRMGTIAIGATKTQHIDVDEDFNLILVTDHKWGGFTMAIESDPDINSDAIPSPLFYETIRQNRDLSLTEIKPFTSTGLTEKPVLSPELISLFHEHVEQSVASYHREEYELQTTHDRNISIALIVRLIPTHDFKACEVNVFFHMDAGYVIDNSISYIDPLSEEGSKAEQEGLVSILTRFAIEKEGLDIGLFGQGGYLSIATDDNLFQGEYPLYLLGVGPGSGNVSYSGQPEILLKNPRKNDPKDW